MNTFNIYKNHINAGEIADTLKDIFADVDNLILNEEYSFVEKFDSQTGVVTYSEKPSLFHSCKTCGNYPILAQQKIEKGSLHTILFYFCPRGGIKEIFEKQQSSWSEKDLAPFMINAGKSLEAKSIL